MDHLRRPAAYAVGRCRKHMQADLAHILAGSAVAAAPRLIGWRLVHGDTCAVICETEAYQGVADRGCHASRGRTARTEVLFARSGTIYVYLCYGMHWMLNLVCDDVDVPAAVLIRGTLIDGVDPRRTNGPGKVTQALGIDRRQHGLHLGAGDCPLRLLPPDGPAPRLRWGTRVGIAYAGPLWAGKRWRWWSAGFPAAKG
jgi:DNA-3-methyladenine glycosylase